MVASVKKMLGLDGFDSEKYEDLKLKHLALLVDYFIEIKKLNTNQHQHSTLINQHVDRIIAILLSLNSTHDLATFLKHIQTPLKNLQALADPEIKVPDPELTLLDLLNAITKEEPVPSEKASNLVHTINIETMVCQKNHLNRAVQDVKKITLGEYYATPLIEPTYVCLNAIYNYVMEKSHQDINFDQIMLHWMGVIENKQKLVSLGFEENVNPLVLAAAEMFIENVKIDDEKFYKFKSFVEVFLAKADAIYKQIIELINLETELVKTKMNENVKSEKQTELMAEKEKLASVGRLYELCYEYFSSVIVETLKDKIMGQWAIENGIKNEKNVEHFIDFNIRRFDKLAQTHLAATLLKSNKLHDIPAKIKSIFNDEKERKNFERHLFDFMISHAQQVLHQQLALHEKEWMDFYVGHAYKKKQNYIGKTYMDNLVINPDSVVTGKVIHDLQNTLSLEKEYAEKVLPKLLAKAKADAQAEELQTFKNTQVEELTKELYKQYMMSIKALIEGISEQSTWKVGTLFGRLGGVEMTLNEKPIRLPNNVAKIYKECLSACQDEKYSEHFEEVIQLGTSASQPHRFDFFGWRARDPQAQAFYDVLKQAHEEKFELVNEKTTLRVG